MRHVLLRHLYFLAGLRIATDARWPVIQSEAAEAANLDAIARQQRLRHRIEDHLHRVLRVLGHQLRVALREASDQFRLGHGRPISLSVLFVVLLFVRRPAYCSLRVPRLVAPALAAAFSLRSCFIASVSSDRSFAFTERLTERLLRSTLMIIALTLSPSFRSVRRSSTRSRENSEARR